MLSRRSLLLASAGLAACGREKAIGFHGQCFVANQQSRSVAVVDLNRFRLRKQIPLDAAPAAIVQHTQRRKVFVLAPDAGTISEIDAVTLSAERRAKAGNQAVAMRWSATRDALWVLYRDPASLVEFPLDSLKPARRIRLSSPAEAFDVSQDNQAAVISPQDGTILLASLTRGAIDRTIAVRAAPSLVYYRSDGRHVLTGSAADRSVTIFDVASGRVVVRLPLPLEPRNFCASADHGQLFVSGDGMDAVVIIFPYTTEIEQTVLAGHAPGVMATTGGPPDGGSSVPPYLLVANPENDKVTVLRIDTRGLVAVVQVGRGPRTICMTPDDEYGLVLNYDSGDLAMIRTRALLTPDGYMRRSRSAPVFTMIPVGEKPIGAAVVGYS
jgi:DNA-binding beta-propeller fold protein YncE